MKTPIFIRSLSEEEREHLQEGLRSKDAFTLRRCQGPMPGAPGEFEGGGGPEDRLEPRMRPANGSERHPRLQREGSGCARCQILAPQKDPRGLRREERRSLAGDAPPLAEGVRLRHESVDSCDGRRGRFRGGTHRKAGIRGDHPGDAFAPAWREVDAGEAMDYFSRSSLRKKKGGATV